jgi:hypothetical protein
LEPLALFERRLHPQVRRSRQNPFCERQDAFHVEFVQFRGVTVDPEHPQDAENLPPATAPPSSANVYRPKSVTLAWVIGDDGEDVGDGDDTGESQEAGDESPAMQIAPIVPDEIEPEDDRSKFFAPGSAKEPISAGPVARGVKRGPRHTMSAEDAADRPKRARKAPAGGGGARRAAPARRKKA